MTQFMSCIETSIRIAVAADVPEVARIVKAAYRHYIRRIGRPPRPMLDDYCARVSERVVWVIEDRTSVVGILVLVILLLRIPIVRYLMRDAQHFAAGAGAISAVLCVAGVGFGPRIRRVAP